jgi:hypothetical protein
MASMVSPGRPISRISSSVDQGRCRSSTSSSSRMVASARRCVGQAPGFVTLPDDGRIYLFDTSIWSHTEHPLIASDWTAMLRNDRIAVSPVVAFEVLYTAQNQADFEALKNSSTPCDRCP